MSAVAEGQIVDDQVEIPVELCKRGPDLFVVSLSLPRRHFRDPFFIDSLSRSFSILKTEIKLPEEDELLARPVHYDRKDGRVIYTSVDKFIKKYSDIEIDKNLGFIFHMSRCGSTLVTQMLASNDRFFVLSEPTIVNAILDPALILTQDKRSLLLRASVRALIKCSPRTCEQVFIKFRSWNVLYLEQILKIFSKIPWMFVHRHGLEVLQSVLEKQPGWLRSRKNYTKYFSPFLKVDDVSVSVMTNDEYATRMLGTFCAIARNSISKNQLFIDYDELKSHLITAIKKLWNLDLNDTEIGIMRDVSKLYSKDINRKVQFQSDSEAKRAKATRVQEELVKKFVENERVKFTNS